MFVHIFIHHFCWDVLKGVCPIYVIQRNGFEKKGYLRKIMKKLNLKGKNNTHTKTFEVRVTASTLE